MLSWNALMTDVTSKINFSLSMAPYYMDFAAGWEVMLI